MVRQVPNYAKFSVGSRLKTLIPRQPGHYQTNQEDHQTKQTKTLPILPMSVDVRVPSDPILQSSTATLNPTIVEPNAPEPCASTVARVELDYSVTALSVNGAPDVQQPPKNTQHPDQLSDQNAKRQKPPTSVPASSDQDNTKESSAAGADQDSGDSEYYDSSWSEVDLEDSNDLSSSTTDSDSEW